MTYQEVLENARKRMAPRCRVCPECNGIACKGVMPGPAGKGASRTFQRNVAWLGEHVKLEMDVTGGNQERNMEISLFGKTFALAEPFLDIALYGDTKRRAITIYRTNLTRQWHRSGSADIDTGLYRIFQSP